MPADTIRTGRCDTGRPLCGKPARLYAAGWRCDDHIPRAYTRPATADTRKEDS